LPGGMTSFYPRDPAMGDRSSKTTLAPVCVGGPESAYCFHPSVFEDVRALRLPVNPLLDLSAAPANQFNVPAECFGSLPAVPRVPAPDGTFPRRPWETWFPHGALEF